MIREVEVRNFRNLQDGSFRITSPMIVAGPNNSGKTSLLRAILLWSELAAMWWAEGGDLARDDDGTYRLIEKQLGRLESVPLLVSDSLWRRKVVTEPVRIGLRANGWQVAFEIVHRHSELISFRPERAVSEQDLEGLRDRPLRTVYVPPVSGLDVREPRLDPRTISGYLSIAQAGSILRTLLHVVSQDEAKWELLTAEARRWFAVDLHRPVAGPTTIWVGYREASGGPTYELEGAGAGMLHVLMMQAALLHAEGSVVLIDEPDAHLHPWLVDKMLRHLLDFAQRSGSQLVAVTHSVDLIRAADRNRLSVLVDGRQTTIADQRDAEMARRAVELLDPEDLALAPASPGVLYVEDYTDIATLRAWAERLDHPAFRFLDRPFWKRCALGRRFGPPEHHRMLRRLVASKLPGIVLRDGDGKQRKPSVSGRRNGLRRLFWTRYEIESYLIHPRALVRFVTAEAGEDAGERAAKHIWSSLPPKIFAAPLDRDDYLDESKGKVILAGLLSVMETPLSSREYWRIAAQMEPGEIHPEVVEKLDAIAEWFGLTGDAGAEVSGE